MNNPTHKPTRYQQFLQRYGFFNPTGRGYVPRPLGLFVDPTTGAPMVASGGRAFQNMVFVDDRNHPTYVYPQGQLRGFYRIGNDWRL